MSELGGTNSNNIFNNSNKNKVLLNVNKKKKMSLFSIIFIACVIGSAIGLFGVNVWHAFSCSGEQNPSNHENIEALTHRLAQAEAKALSTTKETFALIKLLEKKLLDIDIASMDALQQESHDEAVRLALSLERYPAPPMPLFEEAWAEISSGEGGGYKDDFQFNSSGYMDDVLSVKYDPAEKSKDAFSIDLFSVDKATVLLTDAEAETTCKEWKDKYSVMPGKTWGSLPSELQQKWLEYSCDYFLMEKIS